MSYSYLHVQGVSSSHWYATLRWCNVIIQHWGDHAIGKLLLSSSKPSQKKAASATLFIEACLTRKSDPVERPEALDLMKPDCMRNWIGMHAIADGARRIKKGDVRVCRVGSSRRSFAPHCGILSCHKRIFPIATAAPARLQRHNWYDYTSSLSQYGAISNPISIMLELIGYTQITSNQNVAYEKVAKMLEGECLSIVGEICEGYYSICLFNVK